jgi:hypothetical protein
MLFRNASIHDWKDIGSTLFMDITKKKLYVPRSIARRSKKKKAL